MANSSLLPEDWDVPQVFRDRLGSDVGRQRAMVSDGHLLLVLHAAPVAGTPGRTGRFFWRNADGTWRATGESGADAPVEQFLEEYAEAIRQLEMRDESASRAEEYFGVVSSAAPLHRATRNLHAVLQEAREQLPGGRDLIDLRDQGYQLDRRAELLYSDARNGLEFAIAMRSEEQARSSHAMSVAAHRLNVLAAFFFPIATLTAIFGVNLRTGVEPFDDQYGPWVFASVLLGGLFLGFVLALFITRRAN